MEVVTAEIHWKKIANWRYSIEESLYKFLCFSC